MSILRAEGPAGECSLYATLPVWRVPLVGLSPRLDQILAAGCLY